MSNQRRNERNVWPHLFEWMRQRNKFNLLNLNGANLEGANLEGANLEGANLWGAKLQYANLRNANLQYAKLWGADLRKASLEYANLQYAKLEGANLEGANLERACLWKARLEYAKLEGCVMNWQSHDLIAERLRQWAGADPERRLAAGYVLINRDRCWDKLLKNIPPALNHIKQAALAEMATWVREDDNAPSILTRCMSEQQRNNTNHI